MKEWLSIMELSKEQGNGQRSFRGIMQATIKCLSKMDGHDILEFSTRKFSEKKMRELSRELGRMWPLPLEGEDKVEITFEGEEMEGLKRLWNTFKQL